MGTENEEEFSCSLSVDLAREKKYFQNQYRMGRCPRYEDRGTSHQQGLVGFKATTHYRCNTVDPIELNLLQDVAKTQQRNSSSKFLD